MDNGLVQFCTDNNVHVIGVLILIVVDNGLVPSSFGFIISQLTGLNPCCSGQWSSTRPYKTILIISKIKNFTKQILTFLNRKSTIS